MTAKSKRVQQGPTVFDAASTFQNVRRHPSRVPLMLSTSIALLGGIGYVQRAYAQTVNQGSLSASNAVTVELYGPGTFETQTGFAVDVSVAGVDAITITVRRHIKWDNIAV